MGNFFEEAREAVNFVTEILCQNMDSYIQHHNVLHNVYHSEKLDAPGKVYYSEIEYQSVKRDGL